MNQDVLSAKKEIVDEIVNKANASQAFVICEYRGLTVAQIQELRRALRAVNAEMCVYKNSLVERACDQLGYEVKDYLAGPNAFFFSEDINSAAKVVAKYAKRFGDSLTIKGGVFEGKTVADKAKVLEIAKMPDREGLLSMLLSCLQAPIRQFACTVKAVADAK